MIIWLLKKMLWKGDKPLILTDLAFVGVAVWYMGCTVSRIGRRCSGIAGVRSNTISNR